ncbi:crocetin glucoside glucosyltransferase-like protein [Carex littledalei]|uniref:Crocetin glucoside glucosyltransferase-like protein n=1 Tax=Carex littledalei TaxID=544730 RepID=A0A833QP00_9POAL|nr:crocetin glucoside glucosyltransferase-like protein [Carex littledalei]
MDNSRKKSLNVLMLPWLAHGHANRYLELGKRLTQQLDNLSIHFCSTPIILESIRDNLHRLSTVTIPLSQPPPQTRINLIELHLPESAGLPPHLHTTKHLPSHLNPILSRAFAQSEETFAQILETVKPDLVIFDIFQPWAAKQAHQRNIPAVVYIGCTVAMSWYAHSYFSPGKEFPFSEISQTKDNRSEKKGSAGDEQNYRRIIETVILSLKLADFVITRSFREIESKYIDYFSTLLGKEVVPTGPLIPDIGSVSPGDYQEAEEVMHWLNQRQMRSVVFVSFGSECFMPYKEMEQLAHGLELSGACFIWVARFPKIKQKSEEGDCEETNEISAKALLHGLVERVGRERGLVVTSWAPQRKILVHPNLGTFLTHCGWSSVIEGMHAGIPLLALPMDWDQPMNAQLIVNLGVGVQISQRGLGNFTGKDVAASIKQILSSEIGDNVRKNAQDLGELIRTRKDDEIRILSDKILGLVSNVQAA